MINLLLADDDKDDRLFFDIALREVEIPAQLHAVTDGEKLMTYLSIHVFDLPDILFLDLNMPRKNGQECLQEIKGDTMLRTLPVIVYSTCMRDDIADTLYSMGAHYYIQKTDIPGLQNVLSVFLSRLAQQKFIRPSRNQFMLTADNILQPKTKSLLQE